MENIMKCKIIEDEPGKFIPQVRSQFCWFTIKRFADNHPHMSDSQFKYSYDNIDDARLGLSAFSRELREAAKRKRKIHLTGIVNEVEFLEKI